MAKATWWIKVIILFLFWTNLISNLSKCYLPDKRSTGKNVMFVVYLKIRKFSQGSKEQTSSQVESRLKLITWLDISLYFVRLGCFDYAHLGVRVVFTPILFYMASSGQHPSNTKFNLKTNLGRKFCCTWATEILRKSGYTTTWLAQ